MNEIIDLDVIEESPIDLDVVEDSEIPVEVDMAINVSASNRKYSDPNRDGNIIITEVS